MSLPTPVQRLLRRPLDEIATQRMWRRIQARRGAPMGRRSWLLLVAAALALAVALLLVLRRDRGGPLQLDADRVVLEVDAGSAPLRVEASDGSAITVAPRARLEVVENTDGAFSTLLLRGGVRFEVRPGGPRRWTVDCGAFAVEVVGTAFEVERDDEEARVAVEHGEVVVRGEGVPGRLARLRAGDSLAVPLSARRDHAVGAAESDRGPRAPPPSSGAAASPSASAASAPRSSAMAPVSPPALVPSVAAEERGAWRELARVGDYAEAYQALGPGGLRDATRVATVDELFALADVARLSGHPADAVAPLQRILSESGGDRRASIAALTLGRLQLDALGQPAAAAASLNRAIAAGLPSGLAEDALARRVEAYARSGDLDAARASLTELERRFPASGRLAAARRLVAPAP